MIYPYGVVMATMVMEAMVMAMVMDMEKVRQTENQGILKMSRISVEVGRGGSRLNKDIITYCRDNFCNQFNLE